MNETINKYIMQLYRDDRIDKDCKTCQEDFIPRLMNGARLSDIFAPRHKASENCKSGKHPHCTCDTCF